MPLETTKPVSSNAAPWAHLAGPSPGFNPHHP